MTLSQLSGYKRGISFHSYWNSTNTHDMKAMGRGGIAFQKIRDERFRNCNVAEMSIRSKR